MMHIQTLESTIINSVAPTKGFLSFDTINGKVLMFDGLQWVDVSMHERYEVTLFDGLEEITSFRIKSFFDIKVNGVYRLLNLNDSSILWCYVFNDGLHVEEIHSKTQIKQHLELSDEELMLFILKYGDNF